MSERSELSKEAISLLDEILSNLNDENSPVDGYWEQRFSTLGVAEQFEMWSLFEELANAKCLSYLKGDDYPYFIALTSKGVHYFDSTGSDKKKMGTGVVLHTAFDDYILKEKIGQGGNGIVYKCLNNDQTELAVKIINRDQAKKDQIKRFKNEINFCLQETHANIIKILDYGTYQDQNALYMFCIMPFYPNTLRDKIKEGISPGKALEYFQKLLQGLEYAHSEGVVHRDIKPENILIDDNLNTIVISDFGIAHFEAEKRATSVKTDKTDRLANFQYASPEQRKKGNIKNVDGRSDVFSLGLIVNEMFTGSVPLGTNYKKIGTVEPDFVFLDELFDRMTCQEPDDRIYPTSSIITTLNALIHEAKLNRENDEINNAVPINIEYQEIKLDIKDIQFKNNKLIFTLTDDVPKRCVNILVSENYGFQATSAILPRNAIAKGNTISFQVKNGYSEKQITETVGYFKQWLKYSVAAYNAEIKYQIQEEKKRQEREALKRISQNKKEISLNNKLKELI